MTVGIEIGLGRRNQITLPKKFIPEKTSSFVCAKREDGSILLIPQAAIPVSQLYFWSKRWQEGEQEASEDIRKGKLYYGATVRDVFNELDKRRAKR